MTVLNTRSVCLEELEVHYAKSPFVREICVVRLQGRSGEPQAGRLHAVIVPDYEVLRQRKIVNIKDVIRFDVDGLSAQLPDSNRIVSYEIWQHELPRTSNGELKRHEIEQCVAGGLGGIAHVRKFTDADLAWAKLPDVARALSVIEKRSRQRDDIHPDDNLELDLGFDSMERIELLVAVEQALNAHADEAVASQVYTVREMVDSVRAGAGLPATASEAGWDAVLATEPDNPEVLNLVRPPGIVGMLWYLAFRLLYLFCRDTCQLKVIGLDKLSEQGPYLICPNHQSLLDAPVVLSLLPGNIYRKVFALGTSEIWGWGWRRKVARTLRLVPIDPDSNLVSGMRAAAYGLRRGKILMLYPEGERSIDGAPKTFKKGAAVLSVHLRVPIYPVAIDGFHEAWPRGKPPQRFSKLIVRFGDAIMPLPVGKNPEMEYAQLTAELRRSVFEMWKELHGSEQTKEKASGRAATTD